MRTTIAAPVVVAAAWSTSLLATATVWPPPVGVLRIAAADALAIEAVAVAIAAPLIGVAAARATDPAASGHARAALILRRFAPSLIAFAIASCIAALLASSATGVGVGMILRSHVTLFAVATALATLGAFCAVRCRDVLDASAAAVALTVTLSAAVFAGGPATGNLPQAAIDLGLLASPPMAISSSAGLDPLRSEVLYRLSPISHRRFTYPAWHVAAASYAAVAGLFALGIAWKSPHQSRKDLE